MMRRFLRHAPGIAALGLLAACVGAPPVERPGPAPTPAPTTTAETAAELGVRRGPAVAELGLLPQDSAAALRSFTESCRVATTRQDASGLTRPGDWQAACRSAPAWPAADAARFFATYFEAAEVGEGAAFATGYFEPEILGSRTRRPGFEQPVYAMPPDLVRDATYTGEGRAPLGRVGMSGQHVPYYTRAEIVNGALDGRAPVIAWAADRVEFFFLQIQGSGRLVTPEGEVIRIGYAGQNGRGYTGIGALMRENKSWVFFRVLTGDGPLGSIGVPVRGESSVAVDPRFVPYGAPVWLDLDRDVADGLWVAQDTGGAIRGANRFDTFWGAGQQAREIAGGMSGRGDAYILLPKGVVDRINSNRR